MKKIGINGFGRIGRLVLRRILETGSEVEIVAINDLTSPKVLAYLLKHDSSYRDFAGSVDFTDNAIIVNNKKIAVYAEKEAKNIPWGTLGVEIVVESTGFYASGEKAQAHLDAGAKKSADFRACRGYENHRVQRERRYHHPGRPLPFRRILHHQLPGADGKSP